jgi:hypothetical protein
MTTILPASEPTDETDRRLELWQYIRELGSGQDMLEEVALHARELNTRASLRLAQVITDGNDPMWLEAQLTLWYNSPLMGSCRPGTDLDREAERLSLEPHMAYEVLMAILDTAAVRLPNWNSYCGNHE